MRNKPTREVEAAPLQSWWRQPEVAFLLVLVALAYFVRSGDVLMRGEEPTWAQIAFEMGQKGDWIVPRIQGQPFLSRPPLHNWLIAVSSAVCGSREAWAVRLPSVLAMLLTTLLIYGYARTCLSRVGALAAAAAFPTFGEMFTTGYQAHTDMVFIALVSAALLLWHWGQVAAWPATRTWILSYLCVALAILCKGPQPPVYFLGSVTLYLLWTGQWRRLFTRGHLAGALVGGALVFGWLIPCVLRTGWSQAWAILLNDTSNRFQAWNAFEVGVHLVQFPLEVLGCTLPWSLLLFGFASRGLRSSLGAAQPQALFLTIAVGFAFLTIWIPPGGQTRYFDPLYPCLAVLIGLAVESCLKADVPAAVRAGWRLFTVSVACLMAGTALAVIAAAFFLANHPSYAHWAEAPLVALGYTAAVFLLIGLTLKGRHAGDARQVRTTVLALACFMVLTFTGIFTNVRIRRSEDQAAAVARLKERLPDGQRLVSFGPIDILFAYYYSRPIDLRPIPAKETDLGEEKDLCFCFNSEGASRPALPFRWQEVAAISMDRNKSPAPENVVVVGRRLKTQDPTVPDPHGSGPHAD